MTHQPESHIPDFDVEVEAAWDDFTARLTEYVKEMETLDGLLIQSDQDTVDDAGEMPASVRISGVDDGVLRCDVPPNSVLHPVRMLTIEDHELLVELGWTRPTRSEDEEWYFLDIRQQQSALLSAKIVTVFREIWDVAHPSFLSATHRGNPSGREFVTFAHTPAANGVEHVSELQSDVDDALESLFGERPLKDEDGDVRLAFEHGCSYIRAHEQTVQIVALIPGELNTSARTGAEMGALDRRWPTIKFLIQDDYFVAESRVDCSPFSTEHMLRAVCTFQSFLASVDEDFVENMNSAGDSSEPMPPELLTLLYLDPDSTGTLDDSEVALICHDDRDLILELIRQCSVQELEWQSSIENAAEDDDDLPVFIAETTTWKQNKDRLVGALRFVVLEKRHR